MSFTDNENSQETAWLRENTTALLPKKQLVNLDGEN
jgi:hypothetical protein